MLLGAAALVVTVFPPAATMASQGPKVIVELLTGEQAAGKLELRAAGSREEALTLSLTGRGISLRRRIAWSRIKAARVAGRRFTAERKAEFWAHADSLVAPIASTAAGEPAESPATAPLGPRAVQPQPPRRQASPPTVAEFLPPGRVAALTGKSRFNGRIRSIEIETGLANWDGDTEQDGLLLRLFALDETGCLRPVTGTVRAWLIAPQRRAFHHAAHSRGQRLERIGEWTAAISPRDYASGGAAVVKLPFQAVHPEFSSDTSYLGLVHVEFTVPGHGVFHASRDAVRIRPFAPLRDLHERTNSRRFFDIEHTGRGKTWWGRVDE